MSVDEEILHSSRLQSTKVYESNLQFDIEQYRSNNLESKLYQESELEFEQESVDINRFIMTTKLNKLNSTAR